MIPTHISAAGKFAVEQSPCPAYCGPVLLNVPRAGVLHTTEGDTIEGALPEFKVKWAPTFLLGYDHTKKVRILQLIPIGAAGAALEAHNNLAMVQIEMTGEAKDHLWLPDSPVLDALASLLGTLRDVAGIPLSHPYPDGSFGMYGRNNHHRDKFGTVAGWFGHADVPDNDHWDPGDIEWTKIFARANQLVPPAPVKPVVSAIPAPASKPLPPVTKAA